MLDGSVAHESSRNWNMVEVFKSLTWSSFRVLVYGFKCVVNAGVAAMVFFLVCAKAARV